MRFFYAIAVFFPILLGSAASAATLTVTQSLSFGTWIPNASSGSIRVSQSGAVSSSGVTAAPSGGAAFNAILKFTGSGLLSDILDVVTITPQVSSVTLTGSGGGTVTVGNFTPQTGLGVSLLNPSVNIPMGGTLTFSGNPRGTYTGTVQVQGSGLLSGTALAQVSISVTFWRALSVSEQTGMDFGAIGLQGQGACVVRLDPQTGVRTLVSGTAALISSPSSTADTFLISGEPSRSVSVTLPSSIILTGPGTSMNITSLTKSVQNPQLDTTGALTLGIGGDLNINANQVSGTYTGTYTLTINY